MRLVLAAVLGLVVAAGSALVLGDYPLSGSVPWISAVLIPLLVGLAMTLVAERQRVPLWVATGPLAAAAFGWGVWIATGRGLDPVPTSAVVSGVLVLVWPPLWGIVLARRPAGRRTDPAA